MGSCLILSATVSCVLGVALQVHEEPLMLAVADMPDLLETLKVRQTKDPLSGCCIHSASCNFFCGTGIACALGDAYCIHAQKGPAPC
jgi:hypothetical protein